MTRMFTGGRDGGGSGGNPLFDKYEKRSAKDTFLKKMRGIDDSKLTPEERYQKNVDKKVQELRNKAMMGGSKYSFSLPGTQQDQEKKLSKNMEAFIQRIAAKKAKEELKKEMERAQIQIKAKYLTGLYGGSIGKDGKIYGPDRKLIAKINPKTGKIMSQSGIYIGKYDPKSPMSEHKIQQFIADMYNPNKKNWMGQSINKAGGNSGGGMGSFYGHSDDKGGGGFWG